MLLLFRRRLPLAAALVAPFMLSGCVVAENHRYSEALAALQVSGTTKVAVVVHDTRPNIVSGEKAQDVTGVVRGLFGNPHDVKTASGKPLAEDLSHAVVTSLKKKGFEAFSVRTAPADSNEEVERKIHDSGADRSVLLEVRQWSSDTWSRTALDYDVNLRLRRENDARQWELNQSGRENLGSSFWHPRVYARSAVTDFLRKKIEEWLGGSSATEILP